MKKGLFFVAALFVTGLASAITTSVIAQDNSFPGEFSGNVTLTSDYVFRGFTQANEDPAIQGGLDSARRSSG